MHHRQSEDLDHDRGVVGVAQVPVRPTHLDRPAGKTDDPGGPALAEGADDEERVHPLIEKMARVEVCLEHAPNGRIDVDVTAAELQGVEVIEVVVADNGPGFKSNSLNQIFDPYVTTKPKGTGLGLAIVKKLVEEHAGTIAAENRDEGGARIIIHLPVNEAARGQMIANLPKRAEQRRERA